jgi:hypothetical protein
MQLKRPTNYFEMDRKWLELHALCFPLLQACPLTSVLTGIKLTAEQNMWSKNVYFIHAHHWATLIPVFNE